MYFNVYLNSEIYVFTTRPMFYVTYPILLWIELSVAMHSETAWRILKEMNRQDG